MTKFLFLYSGGSMPESEVDQSQFMKDWEKWETDLGSTLVDPGNPMSMIKNLSGDGHDHNDQSLATASGYSIINADSHEKAVEIAKTSPVFLGGSDVSIFETFNM